MRWSPARVLLLPPYRDLAVDKQKSKTWFITGCDSGMGYALAETLLAHGETVVVTARQVDSVAALLKQYPASAFGHQLDVTQTGRIAEVVAQAEAQTGGIDVLVNNAGYGVLGAAEETSAIEYRAMFEVNFFGLVETCRAVLPYMRRRRSGQIFNTSSYGGYAASPGWAMYASSKFAVEGYSEALAQEVAPLGIRVTILEPGSFRTAFAGASLLQTALRIEDYAQTPVALRRTSVNASDGNQPNDPKKLALVLLRVTSMPQVPLRLPLGIDALDRMRKKVASVSAEFERWAPVAVLVGYDAPEDAAHTALPLGG